MKLIAVCLVKSKITLFPQRVKLCDRSHTHSAGSIANKAREQLPALCRQACFWWSCGWDAVRDELQTLETVILKKLAQVTDSYMHTTYNYKKRFLCLLTFYNPVVTVRTNRFNIQKFRVCPHSVFVCFVWISEQTAIISLYNINWFVFITEMKSVYCAVRTESLVRSQGI
jgi:hypothetical protein